MKRKNQLTFKSLFLLYLIAAALMGWIKIEQWKYKYICKRVNAFFSPPKKFIWIKIILQYIFVYFFFNFTIFLFFFIRFTSFKHFIFATLSPLLYCLIVCFIIVYAHASILSHKHFRIFLLPPFSNFVLKNVPNWLIKFLHKIKFNLFLLEKACSSVFLLLYLSLATVDCWIFRCVIFRMHSIYLFMFNLCARYHEKFRLAIVGPDVKWMAVFSLTFFFVSRFCYFY